MNKPTVLGKSPLLLACLCNALKSVLLPSLENSCHPSGLHHGLLIPCCLGLAQTQILASQSSANTAEVAAAPVLEREALTSLSQLACYLEDVSLLSPSFLCPWLLHVHCSLMHLRWFSSLFFSQQWDYPQCFVPGKYHNGVQMLLITLVCIFPFPADTIPQYVNQIVSGNLGSQLFFSYTFVVVLPV